MGLLSRISRIFRAEMNGALDKVEDPKRALDYGLVEMEQNYQKVSRSVLDVAVAKRKLEMQRDLLSDNIAKFEHQAEEALALEREDLARVAIERKQGSVDRRNELEQSISSVGGQLQALERDRTKLCESIDSLRTRKEEITAVYDAAQAQLRVRETLSGISQEISDVRGAIQRAEERIGETQARVEALDEMVAIGIVENVFLADKDDIDRELERIGRSAAVDGELDRLRQKARGTETKQLDTLPAHAE